MSEAEALLFTSHTLTGSHMEFVGQPRASEACSLLGVPGLNPSDLDLDDDEGEVVIGIRPKSSPLPRRKSSVSDEDSEPQPPLCGSRRVSFADAKGLSLVQVKEFDSWDVPKLPGYDSSESEGKDAEEHFLSPVTFSLPLSTEELFSKVQEQKVELEAMELVPGTTILKGVIRVLNISFHKAVYVRTTLDTWSSHFDLLTEYIPGSSDSLTDCFLFKLTLVPPFGEEGARVEFCLRYETPVGTFWANNKNRNYVLFCHQRVEKKNEKPKRENVNKKSCLKTVGQNFTVENNSAMEDSSQENISTDVSKHEEKVDIKKTKQISDGQSGTSAEDGQKLLPESRRNCSRRNRRKAARMARMRDFFAQRDEGANDAERDESPPEAEHAAQVETPEDKLSDVQTFSERSSKTEGSLFESVETCNDPTLDNLHDTSLAHDSTSNSESDTSEISLSGLARITGGEIVTDSQDSPFHLNDDTGPAERQNVNNSKAEESSRKQSWCKAAPADISAMRSESLGSNSFTFGTMVAPLYHQVFGRVGGESQSVGDWGNPERAAMSFADLNHSYPHTDRSETSCTFPTDARGKVNVIKTEQECLQSTPNPIEEEETSVLYHEETLLDPTMRSDQTSEVPKAFSGDTEIYLHSRNSLKTDLSNPQKPSESLRLQGEAQEDNLTHHLQSQTTAETAEAQLTEQTQIKQNLHEMLTQNEREEVMTGSEASFMPAQPSQRVPEHVSDETVDQTSSRGSTDCQRVPQIALEQEGKDYIHGDASVELKSDDILNDEEMIDSGKIQCQEVDAAVWKQDDFCLVDTDEVKNWEMMVEEEEKNILRDEEESKTMSSQADDVEVLEEDRRKELEDMGIEAASENIDKTETEKEEKEDEMLGKITSVMEKEKIDEDADALEDKQRSEEGSIGEIMVRKDGGEVEKELDYVKTTKVEKTAGEDEEELAEETKVEKKGEHEETELEKEKQFAEMQEVSIERMNVQEEEELEEEEEEMMIDLNNDHETGVEGEDRVKPSEEDVGKENPDYKEEILVDETSVIVAADSETMAIGDRRNEAGWFEERLDIVQDERVTDTENTVEEQNAHIPSQIHFYKEESNENAAAGDESVFAGVDGGSCLFAGEPESDQSNHDSASTESDSDDEVELYMHCLRAVHTGAQMHKDRNNDKSVAFSVGRNKLLTTPMPSISESLDEEQPLGCLQDNHEDTADNQSSAAALPASSGQESINTNVSWWTETFSWCNISKTLLYATLFVLFVVVAYHYDFLACLGLYLISVIWLCCQGERNSVKNNNRIG